VRWNAPNPERKRPSRDGLLGRRRNYRIVRVVVMALGRIPAATAAPMLVSAPVVALML
jgi:hypothetical protein